MQAQQVSRYDHSRINENEGTETMEQISVKEAIKRIKEIATANSLNAQRIFEMVDDAHEHVSLNSVKKILQENSEEQRFNADLTVFPVYHALELIYGDYTGNQKIDDLRATIQKKDQSLANLEYMVKDLTIRKDYLKYQIKLKDRRIDRLLGLLEAVTDAKQDEEEEDMYSHYGVVTEDEST